MPPNPCVADPTTVFEIESPAYAHRSERSMSACLINEHMSEIRRQSQSGRPAYRHFTVLKERIMTEFGEWNDYCPDYTRSKVLAHAKLWTEQLERS